MKQANAQLTFIATRPNNRATNLVKALEQLTTNGNALNAVHEPLIKIAPYDDEQWVTEQQNFSFDGVIFISGNAVDSAIQQLSRQQWQDLTKNQLFAIGEQTASVLQAELEKLANNGLKSVKFPQQMNSEGMLDMPELATLKGQYWLIVKGLGGRDTLKAGLIQRGARVEELSVYQRKLPDLAAQKRITQYQKSSVIWLITSLQSLNNLCRILDRQIEDCRIIVSSDRIAQQASKLGYNVVAQATDATDKQLVKCIANFIGNEA